MSIVPPARSMRVGADALTVPGWAPDGTFELYEASERPNLYAGRHSRTGRIGFNGQKAAECPIESYAGVRKSSSQ